MSKDKKTDDKTPAPPITPINPELAQKRQYALAVEAAAQGMYHVFPEAKFTQSTLLKMIDARKHNVPYDQLPIDVKLCLVRLGMAMLKEDDTPAEQEAKTDGDPPVAPETP